MTNVSYTDFTGAENYQRYFVPAIATPISAAAHHRRPAPGRAGSRRRLRHRRDRPPRRRAGRPTGTVTGIDLAPDMINVARSTPSPGGAGIEWHVGDAASLPFGDGTYDAVLCQMGLMFMADRAAAVAEMRRVLAPGGRVVVNTPGAIQPPFVVLEQAIAEHISADLGGFVRAVFSMHDPDALATLLREAGLRDVTARVSPVALRLPAPAEFLWQYINFTPMGPIVAQAPAAARSAMERQAVEAWQPYVVDGTINVESGGWSPGAGNDRRPRAAASGRDPAAPLAGASRRRLGAFGTRVRVRRGRRLAAAAGALSLVIGTVAAVGATGASRDVEVAITDGTSNT